MKKCYQCDRPAMYSVNGGKISLCLDCFAKVSELQQREIENNERMMNYLSSQIYSSAGLPNLGPKFPERPQSLRVEGMQLNNISVENSVVGTINTGTVGSIDQSISAILNTGEQGVAEAIKQLSEATLKSGNLSADEKNEVIEILSVVAREAGAPKEHRRSTAIGTLLERASQITATANDISDLCAKYWPIVAAAFASLGH